MITTKASAKKMLRNESKYVSVVSNVCSLFVVKRRAVMFALNEMSSTETAETEAEQIQVNFRILTP
jgi:hypothetical protein